MLNFKRIIIVNMFNIFKICFIYISGIVCFSLGQEHWYAFKDKAHYVYNGTGINFNNAASECRARSAHLPVITSPDHNDFIKVILGSNYNKRYWLNLEAPILLCSCFIRTEDDCRRCRESWQWRDGTAMTYWNWAGERPQGDGRQCAYIYGDGIGQWDDTSCSNEAPGRSIFLFVCQFDCVSGNCRDHQCTFSDGRYQCSCPGGYTDVHCDTELDECSSSPCEHNGQCIDGRNSYTCECQSGYSGINCDIDDVCGVLPCHNDGVCSRNLLGYTCSCVWGYTGNRCETDINECSSSPCQNGGTCYNLLNRYTCDCPSSHTGVTCQEEINECQSNPCLNDGICRDDTGRYRCECQVGFTGEDCELDIDECEANPCQNNGTCENYVGYYNCNCVCGNEGNNCEYELKYSRNSSDNCKDNKNLGLLAALVLFIMTYIFSASIAIILYMKLRATKAAMYIESSMKMDDLNKRDPDATPNPTTKNATYEDVEVKSDDSAVPYESINAIFEDYANAYQIINN